MYQYSTGKIILYFRVLNMKDAKNTIIEMTNDKIQISNDIQFTITNYIYIKINHLIIGYWNLSDIWILEFGIYSLWFLKYSCRKREGTSIAWD